MADKFSPVGMAFGNALTNVVSMLNAGTIEFSTDDVVAELVDFAGSLTVAALAKQDEIAGEIAPAASSRRPAPAPRGGGRSSGGGRGGRSGGYSGGPIKDPNAPLTDAQFNKLVNLGESEADIEGLSKQEASDLIQSLI